MKKIEAPPCRLLAVPRITTLSGGIKVEVIVSDQLAPKAVNAIFDCMCSWEELRAVDQIYGLGYCDDTADRRGIVIVSRVDLPFH